MVRQPTGKFSLSFLILGNSTWPNPPNGSKGQVGYVHVQLRPQLIATPAGALSDEETEAREG